MVLGLNDAVAPAGTPLALKVTGAVNPLVELSVAVKLVDEPAVTVAEVGLNGTLKEGSPSTVRSKLIESVPPVRVSVAVIPICQVPSPGGIFAVTLAMAPTVTVGVLMLKPGMFELPVRLKLSELPGLLETKTSKGEVPDSVKCTAKSLSVCVIWPR